MFWRLHAELFDERLFDAIDWIASKGDQVQVVTGPPSKLAPVEFDGSGPALALTTLQDARRTLGFQAVPWLYFDLKRYNVSHWMANLDEYTPILNRDGVFLPYAMAQQLPAKHRHHLAGGAPSLFIRPDDGQKSFTGFTLPAGEGFSESLAREMRVRRNVAPEDLCLVTSAKELLPAEWRFWIVNREVVAHSPYSWEEKPLWRPAPEDALAIAQAVAVQAWQPDIAYVVDVVHTASGKAFLNELNAASTSGIYQAPLGALLGALRQACIEEFDGTLVKDC